MGKNVKNPHFENGLISEMRDHASAPDKDLIKKAIKESKKAKVNGKSVFSNLSKKAAEKLLS